MRAVLGGMFLFFASQSFAVQIFYEVTCDGPGLTGGTRCLYDYTVFNNDVDAGIEAFEIIFPIGTTDFEVDDDGFPTQFPESPGGWLGDIFPSADFGPPAEDGFVSWFADFDLIALGEELAGFSVAFDWLAFDPADANFRLPGSQAFRVLDFELAEIATGFTELRGVTQVPEPSSLGLLILGLLALFGARRRQLICP